MIVLKLGDASTELYINIREGVLGGWLDSQLKKALQSFDIPLLSKIAAQSEADYFLYFRFVRGAFIDLDTEEFNECTAVVSGDFLVRAVCDSPEVAPFSYETSNFFHQP